MADLDVFRLEGLQLGSEGLKAMERLARQIVRRDNGQSLYLRDLLLSLYNGHPVALSTVTALDAQLRRDLCAVILGLDRGDFEDYRIREIMIAAGDRDAAWFLAGLRTE